MTPFRWKSALLYTSQVGNTNLGCSLRITLYDPVAVDTLRLGDLYYDLN